LSPKVILALVVFGAIFTSPAFAQTTTVEINGNEYHIEYTSTGIEIKSVSADEGGWTALIFDVSVIDSTGNMEISFDRSFFDAKFQGEDDSFFVLADGEEVSFNETKDDSIRTLSFSLSQDTEELEIIGTILAGQSNFLEQEKEAAAIAQAEAEAEAEAAAKAEAEAAAKAEAEAAAKAEAEAAAKLEKLIESCGEGTIFQDGICVVLEKESIDTNPLIYSITIAFGIGIAAMLILWAIGKAGRRNHKELTDDESDDS